MQQPPLDIDINLLMGFNQQTIINNPNSNNVPNLNTRSDNGERKYIGVTRLKISDNDKKKPTDVTRGWGVSISISNKSTWLGSFPEDQLEHAAKVYDAYALYYHRRLASNGDIIYPPLNGLLSASEKLDIETNGIPDKYKKKVIPLKELPKGISRRGHKYRVCIESKGRKLDKVVGSLDEALLILHQQRDIWE